MTLSSRIWAQQAYFWKSSKAFYRKKLTAQAYSFWVHKVLHNRTDPLNIWLKIWQQGIWESFCIPLLSRVSDMVIYSRNMREEWIKEQEWVTDQSQLLQSAIKLMEAITDIQLYSFSTFVSNRDRELCGCLS